MEEVGKPRWKESWCISSGSLDLQDMLGWPRMVPTPLRGGRDLGRNTPLEEGSTVPILSSDMEIEKGKGLASSHEPHLDGEGTSGFKKEETTKLETRRT